MILLLIQINAVLLKFIKEYLKKVLTFSQKRNQQNTVVDIDNNKNLY